MGTNEARILSRLDHPGICRLYDLVEETDRSCLMLEFVEGAPLDELAGSLDEATILEYGRQIADSLAAAHHEGIVHRDIKPANVMITDDGTVKVLDFGISRLLEDVESETLKEEAPVEVEQAPGLTVTGSIIGTPRFMSPEQARGEPVTPASDVFGMGLTLCALITGRSPITDENLAQALLAAASAQHEIPEDLSPEFRALIEDSLQPEPGDRPTAAEVARRLGEIIEAPRRRKRRIMLGAAGVLTLFVVVAAVFIGRNIGEGRWRCRGFESHLEGVWDLSARNALQEAFASVGSGETVSVVAPVLDAYAQDWVAQRSEACSKTWVRGEQSPEMLDLENACFDRRLEELSALISVLTGDPEGTRFKAAQAAHALTPVSVCLNTQLLSTEVPIPDNPAVRKAVDGIRAELARIKALYDTGSYQPAWEAVTSIEDGVLETGYAPLSAEFQYLKGLLAEKHGDMGLALSTLQEAILAGEAGRHDRMVAQSWIRRVWVRGVVLTQTDVVATDIRFAQASIDRVGGDDELEGALTNHRAVIESDGMTRLELCLEALELRRSAFGERHPKVASTMQNCSNYLRNLGRVEESLEMAQEAYEMRLELLGPNHPSVLISLNGVAAALDDLGRGDEALELLRQALDLAERTYPEGHPAIARIKINLADQLSARGENEEALKLAQEAATSLTKSLGPDAIATADAWSNVGTAARRIDDWELSLKASEESRRIYRSRYGPNDPRTVRSAIKVGNALTNLDRYERGISVLEQALAGAEKGDSSLEDVCIARVSLAQGLIWRGDATDRARELLDQIRRDIEGHEDPVSLSLIEDARHLTAEIR